MPTPIVGTVETWNEEAGWGVINSPSTPGGCWTHFTHIVGNGYRALRPGQPVVFEWEAADQDGYAYRAVQVWPQDYEETDPIPPAEETDPA